MMSRSNKSRPVTLAILAAAAVLAWRNAQFQHAADLDSQRLELECHAAGLDPAAVTASGPPAPASPLARKSARPSVAAVPACDPHVAAARLADYVLAEKISPGQDLARYVAMQELLATIQPAQLEAICADLSANPALDQGDGRRDAFAELFNNVGNRKPRELLDLLDKNPAVAASGSLVYPSYPARIASDCIESLSLSDPAAALDWVRRHSSGAGKAQPDLDEYTCSSILRGIARRDPGQAFSLIGELSANPWSSNSPAIESIARAATDPAAKTATLTAMRDYVAQLQDPWAKQQVIGKLTAQLARSETDKGFASGSAWIDANLTPEETASFIGNLSGSTLSSGQGQWLEWMAGKLPPAELQEKAGTMLSRWANYDYAAAANWLDTTAPGPAREAAILSFAPVAATYQPAAAAGWAATLPPGPGRDTLLGTIYDKWRSSDPAADQFAQEHP